MLTLLIWKETVLPYTFVRSSICALSFCCLTSFAYADSQSAYWFGSREGRNFAEWSAMVGENIGRFFIQDNQHQVRCSTFIMFDSGSGSWKTLKSGGDESQPYCPSDFEVEINLIRANRLSVKAQFNGEQQSYVGSEILPIRKDRAVATPANLDVLGVEIGMSQGEVVEILSKDRNFEQIRSDDKRISQGMNGHQTFQWSMLQTAREAPDPLGFGLEQDQSVRSQVRKLQETSDRIEGLHFTAGSENSGSGVVSVVFVDGKAALIHRVFQTDKNSLAAVYDAINNKYGSFDQGTNGDNRLGRISVLGGNTDQYAGGGWGLSSYDSEGTKQPFATIGVHEGKTNISSKCLSPRALSAPEISFPEVYKSLPGSTPVYSLGGTFGLESFCATDAYFGLDQYGMAEIRVYQAFKFAEVYWSLTVQAYEKAWIEELSKTDTPVSTIVPEL